MKFRNILKTGLILGALALSKPEAGAQNVDAGANIKTPEPIHLSSIDSLKAEIKKLEGLQASLEVELQSKQDAFRKKKDKTTEDLNKADDSADAASEELERLRTQLEDEESEQNRKAFEEADRKHDLLKKIADELRAMLYALDDVVVGEELSSKITELSNTIWDLKESLRESAKSSAVKIKK